MIEKIDVNIITEQIESTNINVKVATTVIFYLLGLYFRKLNEVIEKINNNVIN